MGLAYFTKKIIRLFFCFPVPISIINFLSNLSFFIPDKKSAKNLKQSPSSKWNYYQTVTNFWQVFPNKHATISRRPKDVSAAPGLGRISPRKLWQAGHRFVAFVCVECLPITEFCHLSPPLFDDSKALGGYPIAQPVVNIPPHHIPFCSFCIYIVLVLVQLFSHPTLEILRIRTL